MSLFKNLGMIALDAFGNPKKTMLKDQVVDAVVSPTQTGRMPEYSQSKSKFPDKQLEDWMLPNYLPQAPDNYPTVDLSQFLGHGYTFAESDRTMANRILAGVGNKPLNEPIQLNTGSNFIFHNPQVWTSGKSPISQIYNNAVELERQTGKPTVMFPRLIGPKGSDFSKRTGEVMMRWNVENAPASTVDRMNKMVKDQLPNWKGVDDAASMQDYYNMPTESRLQLQNKLNALKNDGGLSLGNARLAIANPEYINVPDQTLPSAALIDTSKPFAANKNVDYPYGVYGEPQGLLSTPITAKDLYSPDAPLTFSRTGRQEKNQSFFFNRQNARGIIDEPLLRRMEDAGIKVKSGVVPTVATLGTGLYSLFNSGEADAAIVPSALRSIALDAMADVPRKKPTSYTGWKKALNKAGIKDDELKQMGFKREFEFRQRSQDITRQEVEDFLRENQYNIREEVLGQRKMFGEVVHDPELNTYTAEMPFISDNETFHTRAQAEAYVARNPEIMTDYQYGPYTLTGAEGNNYREILLMDGPEADKYEALTDEMLKLENEITDGIGAPRGYLDRDVLIEFDASSQFKEQFDRLQEVRAERNRLAQPFIHRHYDDKENILSHLRVADRDLEDGSSTLMVEEIQSDLHQRGQEYGYAKPNALEDIGTQMDAVDKQLSGLKQTAVTQWAEKNMPDVYKRAYGFDGDLTSDEFTALRKKMVNAFEEDYKKRTGKDRNEEFDRLADLRDSLKERRLKTMNAAPDMPFKSDDKSSWYDLSFKRSLKEAADGDYDSISFTTGQQQVDRYGESAEGGVKTFYDKTLPNHINKWAKQYGVKLERKPIRVGEKDYSVDTYDDGSYFVRNEEGGIIENFDSLEEAEAYIKKQHEIQDVYTLKIPEKMRKDIREKGMPLFAQTGLTIGGATAASGLLSPKAQANEARMQGLLSDSEMRQEVVKGAAAVPDLTAGLVEQFGRDLVNFTAGTINPDYGDIAEGSVFPVTEGGKATLSKAGEAFMKYAAPTLVKGVNSLLDFEPMIGPTARDQMKFVAQQYEKLPESVKEEVTPRLGYAGLLALTAVPAGKAVKKSIKKRRKSKQQ